MGFAKGGAEVRHTHLTTLLNAAVVGAGATTVIGNSATLDLQKAVGASLKIKVAFHALATGNVVIYLCYSDSDADAEYDTQKQIPCEIACNPGVTERAHIRFGAEPPFARVLAENLDGAQSATVTVVGESKGCDCEE